MSMVQLAPIVEIAVVIGANVLGAAMSLPQAVRLIRTRRTAGVSLTWAAMSVVINAWWLVYGVGIKSMAIVPVAVVSVVGYLVIVGALFALGAAGDRSRAAASAAAVGLLPAIGLAVGGWSAAGVVLGLAYGIQLAPAVIGACRARDLRGISAGTWVLAWTEALLWGIYGWPRGDAGLTALAVVGMVLSTVVLARLGRSRLEHRAPVAAAA